MKLLKISELPQSKTTIDYIDNCFFVKNINTNYMESISMKSFFDWIIEQAKEGDFRISLNEEQTQITFSKIENFTD